MAKYIKREALLDSICHETCGIAFCGAKMDGGADDA